MDTLRISVPVDSFECICKAAVDHIGHEHDSEEEDAFSRVNPAAKKLNQIVSETYDAMSFSLLKELSEVFRGE